MAAKSSFKNMVVVLGLICLVSSALLGMVYSVTKEPIEVAKAAKTNAAIAEVLPAFDNEPGSELFTVTSDGKDYTVYPAKSGDKVVGYAIESSIAGFGGEIKLMVGFDAASGTICNTSVISHSETPGLGAKITDKDGFRTQFAGFNPAEKVLKVKKDGGAVDAITASTISSRAFTEAVQYAYNVFKTLKEDSKDE
ncbi:MAG: RnfABCDGE type electron transport complex subunit G [Bacteroidales bacterium]|nr:RnfABCDGE type electron transport complex subunit G [Bacteroidales bacterium]